MTATIRVTAPANPELSQVDISDLPSVTGLDLTYLIEIETGNGTESFKATLEQIRNLFNNNFVGLLQASDDLNYYFFGGITAGGAWKINRYAKSNLEKTFATVVENPSVTALNTAWSSKETLNYVS